MSKILSRIDHPHEVKKLSLDELRALAGEIRQVIVDTVDRTGGHLGSNLGSVELTLALHRVYDFPRDRLVWDVSHQTYPHKLITGRRDRFATIRQYEGICGFCNKRESIFDLFDAGHAGTAVSLGLGVAAGDDYQGESNKTIAVVGDAAIAAGMAFEGLNHAGEIRKNLLVVLNDNKMSIARSVGALSMYLNRLRTKPLYQDFKKEAHEVLSRIPIVGRKMEGAIENFMERVKHSLVPGLLFQELGFNYYGPIDGHDLPALIQTLHDLKKIHAPVLLHLLTVKGQGYSPASRDPIKYHALKNFKKSGAEKKASEVATAGTPPPKPAPYSKVFADTIIEAARKDRRIVGITAAMPGGTGLAHFAKEFPDRYYDVGIAEQHGCAFSSGLAYSGLRPVYAVYSTFCQRAYDQFVHDVCIQENSVIFCLDRGGLVEDGWTHHGVFDIAFMRCIPGVILMAPRDGDELKRMFAFAVDQTTRPVAIRYPRSDAPTDLPRPADGGEIRLGRGEILLDGEDVALVAYGSMVEMCYRAALNLRSRGMNVTVVNARFAKPLDVELIRRLGENHRCLITAEEHALQGGFGSMLLEVSSDEEIRFDRILRLGVPDRFISFGKRDFLLRECGLDAASIEEITARACESLAGGRRKLAPRLLEDDRIVPGLKGLIRN